MALDFTPRPDNSERGVQVVEAQGYAGSAPKDLLVKTDAALKPAFGGALKRPLVFKPLPTTQRSKAVSQKPGVKRTALNGADSGSDSDSDGHVEPNSSTVENGNKTATSHKGQGVTASNLSSLPVVPEQVAKAIRAASTLEKSYPAPSKSVKSSRPSFFVSIDRPEAVQIARVSLPVVGEEQAIMESIYENDVTILCGETGSGKTTQVPQFLYEAGFGDPKHPKFKGMIGITQPRRVAAVSMASRVGEEMSLTGGQVAYQIRYDSTTVKPSTRIKFMTDGVLLRELSGALGIHSEGSSASERGPSGDLLLKKYSCIIIDEAHERTVGTDVLIGWLTRIVSIRNSGKIKGVDPLKLVIMSATLRVEDFTENKGLFPGPSKPPVIKVDGRQYKVTVHYNKKTPELDYVSEAYKKVCKIHTKLPKGGVLVFLTGQREVMSLVTKLRDRFPQKDLRTDSALEGTKMSEKGEGSGNGMMDEVEEADLDATDLANDDFVYDSDDGSDNEESDLEVLPGEDGEDDADDAANDARDEKVEAPLHVLPLYSLLSTKAQMMVFEPPPEGARLVVVATNVAETSLTIPNMRYVVDCGKVKEVGVTISRLRYDIHTGVQTFQIHWTSQASADQRAGRAGRVGPGHCYRLFSSAVFANYFEKFTKPEILRIPIEDVILQMKAMGIQNVVNFPFPTIPSRDQLKRSENLLTHLGILEVSGAVSRITELGKVASRFPVSPRYAKMIVVAAQQKDPAILGFVIAIVSGLSVGDPFVMDDEILKEIEDAADTDEGDEKSRKSSKRAEWFRARHMFEGAAPTSDILRLLAAFGAYSCEARKSQHAAHQFCQDYFLRPKAMEEMLKLQSQLRNIVKDTLTEAELYPAAIAMERLGKLTPPTAKQGVLVRQILLVAFPDHVARLDESYRGPKDASPVYQTMWAEKDEIFVIHPSSCLHNERPAPKWIVYGEIVGKEERVSADTSGLVGVRGALSMDGTKVGNDGSLVAQFGAVPSGSRKKIWIKSVTSVAENWIAGMMPASLCSTGRILDDPEPRYNPKKDSIAGFAIPTLGPKLWMLPTREIDLPEGMLKYAYFAKALLEGVLDFERNSRDCFKILEV
ncbi:P-loop containing nucleoside triphosphate hydrolase protein [Polychytrium aggregatum]|uniref:P-loop containing nucleoside triphosphate hydrolase protein n=1 Tax=Polychytrium aggregatum TaxID=110093 RepID=UPI0022FE520F|nr:P-loop containing nucleoside triphosphate hydrolase protein [Polychytrium aggregatum]KAI9209866.1 P-loop containing nucleoside triphosphate hydrolase protein [Polychytrium aggregatum]